MNAIWQGAIPEVVTVTEYGWSFSAIDLDTVAVEDGDNNLYPDLVFMGVFRNTSICPRARGIWKW